MKESRSTARLAVLVLVMMVMLWSIVPAPVMGMQTRSQAPVSDEAMTSPLFDRLLTQGIDRLESSGIQNAVAATSISAKSSSSVKRNVSVKSSAPAKSSAPVKSNTSVFQPSQKVCTQNCTTAVRGSSIPITADKTPIALNTKTTSPKMSRAAEANDSPAYMASLLTTIDKLEGKQIRAVVYSAKSVPQYDYCGSTYEGATCSSSTCYGTCNGTTCTQSTCGTTCGGATCARSTCGSTCEGVTCNGGATCQDTCSGTTCGMPTCNTTCVLTCASTCQLTCEAATCGSTCKETCASTCAVDCNPTYGTTCTSTCNETCGSTCSSTCLMTCNDTCNSTCSDTCLSTCSTTCASTCTDANCGPTWNSTCAGTCSSTCSDTCGSTCGYTCGSTCQTTCGTTCGDTCGGTCESTCGSTCGDTCSSTCDNTCGSTCESTCYSTCNSTCNGSTCDGSTCSTTCSTTCGTTCQGSTCDSTCGSTCSGSTCSSTCNGSTCDNTCDSSTCLTTCSGSTCSSTCGSTCSSTCTGPTCSSSTCSSTCNDTCGSTCNTTCGTTCSNTCGTTCNTTCGNTCNDTCGSTCSDTCGTTCTDTCGTTCSNTCGNTCGDTCGSTCSGGTCDNTCASTCGTTCGSTCGGTCGGTCGATCSSTCGSTCGTTCGGCNGDTFPPMVDLVATENYVYAYYMDENGVNSSSVHLYIDGVDYTNYGVKSSSEYLLEASDDIPDLDQPHQIAISVTDTRNNNQVVSLSSHLIDPAGEDPDNARPYGTTAYYKLYRDGDIVVRVYNVNDGYIYRELYPGYQSSGSQSCYWDGLDDWGYPVPQGMYCMEVWYCDVPDWEYIGSLWPDPSTYLPIGSNFTHNGSVYGQDKVYRVWSPTEGKLRIKIKGDSGINVYLRDSDKKTRYVLGSTVLAGPNTWTGIERVTGGRGRYYFVWVQGYGSFQVYAEFFQQGKKETRTWNSWYWPTCGTAQGPHLYDTNSAATPLKKFDQVHGTYARSYEEAYHNGTSAWEGHCWGWTLASILSAEPQSANQNGVSFTQNEVKGLYCQLYDTYDPVFHSGQGHAYNHYIGSLNSDYLTADAACQWVYETLFYGLYKQNHGVHIDMPQVVGEVWNYPVYCYESQMKHVTNDASERQRMQIHTNVYGAIDSPWGLSNSEYLSHWFDYRLWFWSNPNGKTSVIMPSSMHAHDWLGSSIGNGSFAHGLTPRYVSWPESMNWTSQTSPFPNPNVTPSRVYSIWPN